MKQSLRHVYTILRTHRLLLVVLTAALLLRLVNLGTNPGQLNRDEAALAYNAVLLKETGADEWGRPWPLALESFGDYKLLGYPLLLVSAFSLFGYSDFVTRLPAALAGVVLVGLMYGLARKTRLSTTLSLVAATIVATSGPLYFFSRMAFEAMVALACFVAAVYLGLETKPPTATRWMAIVILLICSVSTYNTPLLYLPVVLAGYVLSWGALTVKKISLPILVIALVGVMAFVSLSSLISQKSGITIFSDDATRAAYIAHRESGDGLLHRISANRYVYYGAIVAKNYLAHFGPWFLVQRGGAHPWHSLPGSGHYDWFIYGSALIGLMVAARATVPLISTRSFAHGLLGQQAGIRTLLLFWALAVPLPAALTVDAPHSTRTLFFLFLIPLFSAHGMAVLSKVVARRVARFQSYAIGAMGCFVLLSGLWYQYRYHVIFPQQQTVNFQLGFASAIQQASAQFPEQNIAVVDPGGYNYILAAWYLRMRPADFFQTVVRQNPDRIGFRYGERVGQFHFIVQEADRLPDENVLISITAKETGQWVVKPL